MAEGADLTEAVRVQAREAGEILTNEQVNSRARQMRHMTHYRQVINEEKEQMELNILNILRNIDGDIVTYMEKCTMPEKLDIMRVLQQRLGIFNKEGGVTLNVSVLGDNSGGKRKMNFNPAATDWAWDTEMEEYIHLPTAQAIEDKVQKGFQRHSLCSDKCQKIIDERNVFGDS